jgi:hypothetical protein
MGAIEVTGTHSHSLVTDEMILEGLGSLVAVKSEYWAVYDVQ